jgi:hypothetical protein
LITQSNLDHWFTYHPPKGAQQDKYLKVREAGKKFAEVILECTDQPSADQSAAIRHVRDAVMTANQAIACEGR